MRSRTVKRNSPDSLALSASHHQICYKFNYLIYYNSIKIELGTTAHYPSSTEIINSLQISTRDGEYRYRSAKLNLDQWPLFRLFLGERVGGKLSLLKQTVELWSSLTELTADAVAGTYRFGYLPAAPDFESHDYFKVSIYIIVVTMMYFQSLNKFGT